MTWQSSLRHDYGYCDPATCYWCALDLEDAAEDRVREDDPR